MNFFDLLFTEKELADLELQEKLIPVLQDERYVKADTFPDNWGSPDDFQIHLNYESTYFI